MLIYSYQNYQLDGMFEIIDHLNASQHQALTHLYQQTWWGHSRTLTEIEKMIEQSDIVIGIVLRVNQELVGFTRILTDYCYRAVIFDVIVDEYYQGQGLGNLLMKTIVEHPSLQNVEALLLFCRPDMVSFYEKWGFSEGENLGLMIRS
ncbi:MAG: GNAT family N-acetyltransferase [Microcystaceae cyanobacterium]